VLAPALRRPRRRGRRSAACRCARGRRRGDRRQTPRRALSLGAEPREWLKTKCSEVGKFVITGFRDLTPGEIEAITVAEIIGDTLTPVGEVQFGVGRRLRKALEAIRLDRRPGSRRVPVRPVLGAEIKFFGRHRNGMIRDGVVRVVTPLS
jgi:ATP-dependent DNA ligase